MRSITDRVDQWSAEAPNRVALSHGARNITYRELGLVVDQYAHGLRRLLDRSEALFVQMTPSPALVGVLLAAFKSGIRFVPVHPGWSSEQLGDLWLKTGARLAIADEANVAGLRERVPESAVLLIDEALPATEAADSFDAVPVEEAYVYCTSGSTGQPKVVQGSHAGLLHFIEWESEEFPVGAGRRSSLLTAPSFDPFLRDVLLPLFGGGTLCIPEEPSLVVDADALADWLVNAEVNLLHTVPTIFRELLNATDLGHVVALEHVLLAGEPLRGSDVSRANERLPGAQLVNLYGPTETTLATCAHRVRPQDASSTVVPIGRPIRGSRIAVIGEDGGECPDGQVGELIIITDHGSHGYIDDPDRNARTFDFSAGDGLLHYPTGDLGWINEDGLVVCEGRLDHQVKIRGMKVDVAAVEAELCRQPGVADAAVVTGQDDTGAVLGAFVVPTGADVIVGPPLVSELATHMIPSHWQSLERLPRLSTGKINRHDLRQRLDELLHRLADQRVLTDVDDPRERLRGLWCRVLGVEDVTDDTDFIGAGGNSLLAGRLAREMREAFDKQMRPVDVLQNPTVNAQIELLSTTRETVRSPVDRVDDSAPVPATRRQLEIYLASRLATEPCTYNIPKATRVQGPLDVTRLMHALAQLPDQHPSLRTAYRLDEDNLVQKLLPLGDVDVRRLEKPQGDPDVIAQSLIRPFDLEHEAPFRAVVVELGDDDRLLFLDVHHIAVDGVSEELLNGTLNALLADEIPLAEDLSIRELAMEVPGPEANVADFSDLFERLPHLDLSDEQRSHRSQSNRGAVHRFHWAGSPEAMAQLSGAPLTGFEYLTAAYALALSLHAGTDDLVIGIADSGRDDPRTDQTVGMLMNTLPLRLRFPADRTVGEVLEDTRLSTRDAIARGPVPAALLEDPAVPRSPGLHPIFDALLVHQNHARTELHIPGARLEDVPLHTGTAKYALSLYAHPTDAGTDFELEYCPDLFDERFCSRFEQTLRHLLDGLAVTTDRRLNSIELVDDKGPLGNTRSALTAVSSEPVHERFANIAHQRPNLIAICHGDEQMTYGELNARSNAIATALQGHPRFTQGTLVGLLIGRNPDLIAALLAVLKVGGTYLPLDPDHPDARITQILEHSGCQLLISDQDSKLAQDVLALHAVPTSATAPAPVPVSMDDPIYVIYTSGSSGTPKGVELTHGNIANFVDGMSASLDFDERTRICCLTTVSFDIFVLETLVPLAIGGSLVMATAEEQLDLSRLSELLERHQADTLQLTPSRLSIFLNHPESEPRLSGVRTFVVGGEPIRIDAAEQVLGFASKPRLFNVYGPTETAVWSTAKQVTSIEDVSVGREILNTRLHVMDAAGRPRPVGSIGELWIGGSGVANGYLHSPDLTARAFVPDSQHPDERVFRTGDMVRWNDRGELDCLGRRDDQVKVRGYRVELGEIEQCLAAHPAVARCACAARPDAINGGQEIVAVYTATDTVTEAELQATIRDNLPEYFLPHVFVEVTDLPMTSSGKIDLKALLKRVPERIRSSVAPKQDVGAVEFVRQSWQSVLGHDVFGTDDSFFEVGGTSLSLVQLHNALERARPGVVNLAAMFSRPTVNATAELLDIAPDAAPVASPVMLEKPVLLRGQSFVAGHHTPVVDIAKLRAAAERQGVTPTELLAAAFCYLLGRLSGGRPFPWYVIVGDGETRADLDAASMRQAADIVEAAASALRSAKGTHHYRQPSCSPRAFTAAVQRGGDPASHHYDLVLLLDDPLSVPPRIRTNQSRLGPRLGRHLTTLYESALKELINQEIGELQ